MQTRRSFLTACIAAFTAPAIVRASSLMPVSVRPLLSWQDCTKRDGGLLFYDISNCTWSAVGGQIIEWNTVIMLSSRDSLYRPAIRKKPDNQESGYPQQSWREVVGNS